MLRLLLLIAPMCHAKREGAYLADPGATCTREIKTSLGTCSGLHVEKAEVQNTRVMNGVAGLLCCGLGREGLGAFARQGRLYLPGIVA